MVRISLVPVLTPLYLYVSTFRSMCAVPNMAVFCSSLTSWFSGMLLTYFLSHFEMVPVAPIITGITFVFNSTCVELLLLLLLLWFLYGCMPGNGHQVLGAFAKFRKAPINFVMSVLRPHGTTRLPLDGFSWNLIFDSFSKICQENSNFIKIGQE